MKKGVLCVLLIFAILFSIAACNPTTPVPGVDKGTVVLTDGDGSTFIADKKDVKDGTVSSKNDTTKTPVTGGGSILPKNTDPDDPFVTGGNEKAEVIKKGTIPDGTEVTVAKDSSGKPKTLLLRDGTDGKVLASGKFTMECTMSMNLGATGEEVNVPATIVTDGKAYSITFQIETKDLSSFMGNDADNGDSNLTAMKMLFGDPMKFVILNDGSKNYMVFPTVGLYLDTSSAVGSGLDFNLKPDMSAGDKEYVKTSNVKVGSTTYTVEEYRAKNSDSGKTVTYRYYFVGQYLKRLETITPGEDPVIVDVKVVKDKVNSNALKLSKLYKNMESVMGSLG